jgi:hypothetical protein
MTAGQEEAPVASAKERESLAVEFERHADEEGKILLEYRDLSEKLGQSSVGSLVSHILTEEELHHLLLRTMAKWLRERPTARERAIPPDANRAELLRLTHGLQKHEQETIEACRRLKSALSDADDELLACLLEGMALDSEKHYKLLVVAEKMLRA